MYGIYCDECGRKFATDTEGQKIGKDVAIMFLRCPHCGHKRPIIVTDWKYSMKLKGAAKNERNLL